MQFYRFTIWEIDISYVYYSSLAVKDYYQNMYIPATKTKFILKLRKDGRHTSFSITH